MATQKFSADEFQQQIGTGEYTLLDTRTAKDFKQGFIPGSIFIGSDGKIDAWAPKILPRDKKILLVAGNDDVEANLAGAGFEVFGVLEGGFDAWKEAGKPQDLIVDVEADELAMDIPHDEKLKVLDVRTNEEYAENHVKDAVQIPLPELTDPASIASFEDDENIYIHCRSGYRSVIAASLFKKHGMHNVRNVLGGFESIKNTEGFQLEQAPTT